MDFLMELYAKKKKYVEELTFAQAKVAVVTDLINEFEQMNTVEESQAETENLVEDEADTNY